MWFLSLKTSKQTNNNKKSRSVKMLEQQESTTKWIGPWSNYRVHRKKEVVVMETAVLPEVMKYLRHSICNMSIIFKIRTLKRGKLIILAVVWLEGYTCFQMALTLLQLLLDLPSEMSFITFPFKFVGTSLIIHHFYRYGTPWLVFISKSHVFLRELKLFPPKHSK